MLGNDLSAEFHRSTKSYNMKTGLMVIEYKSQLFSYFFYNHWFIDCFSFYQESIWHPWFSSNYVFLATNSESKWETNPVVKDSASTTAVVEVAVAICLNTNYGSIYGSLFALKLEKLLVNDKIPTSCQARMSFKHYIKPYHKMLQTTKMNLKSVTLTSFQKPQFQSVSIFFKFVHPYFPLYVLCLYPLLLSWAV